MDPDRALGRQRGQALMELLLLLPLFLAFVLALLFFVKALSTRLTLTQVCRDTALALGRDPASDDPQALVQAMVRRRGLQGLGEWKASLSSAIAVGSSAPEGVFGSLLSSIVAEKLTVTLAIKRPPWLPHSREPWTLTESVTFKRGTWKEPFAEAARALTK